MKTMTLSHSKKSKPCVSSPTSSSWQRPFWQTRLPLALKAPINQKAKVLNALHAIPAHLAGMLAAQSKAIKINSRFAIALVIFLLLAPFCQVAYLLFPADAFSQTWYYHNWHWFLLIIGPHLFQLITLTGVFLLFPAHSKRAYFLILPAAYSTASILHLSSVQTTEQFHQAIQPHVYVLAALIVFVIFFIADYLTHRKFHQYDALMARAKGLIDSNIDRDTKLQHLKTVFEDLRQFHGKY